MKIINKNIKIEGNGNNVKWNKMRIKIKIRKMNIKINEIKKIKGI